MLVGNTRCSALESIRLVKIVLKGEGMFQRLRFGLFVLTLFLSACVTMQMSPEELKQVGPTEGVVIGSLQIKGGADILGRSKWAFEAIPVPPSHKEPLAKPIRPYTLQATRDGDEELFVTKLPSGMYSFWKLYQPGFSNFIQRTDVYFTVQPGTITYIGRLVVEFPPGLISSLPPNRFGCSTLRFKLMVEDAMVPTLERVRQNYGLSTDVVIPNLMTIRELCQWP